MDSSRSGSRFELRRSREVDLRELSRFLRDEDQPSSRRSQSDGYYAWLIGPGPIGDAISWVACDRGTIVGSLSASLRLARLGPHTLTVGKLEEMKTAPQVRGQGVMSLVYGKICDEAKARGVSMLLGGPTSEHSYPIFTNRLGFSAPFRIVNTVCPVRINRVLDWRSAKSDRSFDESDEPPDDCEGFIEDAIAGSRIWTVRDRSYLLWRYTRHPDPYTFLSLRSAGRLSGLAVLKTTHQRGFSLVNTVELFARRGPERRALLRAVREWSQERTQADFVVTWPPTGRPLEGATSGFVPRLGGSTRIVILPLDDVLVELQEILNDRSSWWLGMGDMLDI